MGVFHSPLGRAESGVPSPIRAPNLRDGPLRDVSSRSKPSGCAYTCFYLGMGFLPSSPAA